MLDAEGVNLMLDEEEIRAAVASWPDAFQERHVAGRLASVRVAYRRLSDDAFAGLLEEAWGRKARSACVASAEAAAFARLPMNVR
jgi:hypothetical protein